MADILLKALSNKPGATELTLVDGPADTGYTLVDGYHAGNVLWEEFYSGMRGTQGARLAGAEPVNRELVLPLHVAGSSQGDLQAKLSAVWTLADEMRRFGGRVTWRPQGSTFRQHYDVLAAAAHSEQFERYFHHGNRHDVVLRAVCGPYLLGDPYDIFDNFSVDLLADYTFDAGAVGNVAVTAGEFDAVANLTTENRAIHTDRGYDYGDQQATVKFKPGATITSFKAGVILKRIDALNYLVVYVDDDGANSRLRLDKSVAGSVSNLTSFNLGARVVNAIPGWVRGRIEEGIVYSEYFLTAPTPMGTPTQSNAHTLAGTDVALFGPDAVGKAGVVWLPQHTDAKLDDFAVEPFTYRDRTLPDLPRLSGTFIGDAPALAEVHVTHSGGAAAPIWAMIAWWERGELNYNRVWNGDFDLTLLDVNGWSVASVTNLNAGAATSRTRITTASKYPPGSLEIVCPATSDTGAHFRIFRRFKRGVTYTAEGWIQSAAAVTNVYVRIGNAAADLIASGNTPLSTAWQRIFVTWTPSADRDDAYIAFNIAAATGTTFRIDGVMVYEGTTAPTSENQSFGRGGYPPIGIIEAESDYVLAPVVNASYRSGFGNRISGSVATFLTTNVIVDPGPLVPDAHGQEEIAIEVWARVEVDAAKAMTAILRAVPVTASTDLITANTRHSVEYGSAGKVVTPPTAGVVFRLVKLGTVNLPTNLGRWILACALSLNAASGTAGCDYLILVPKTRALSPSGKANDSGYPDFIPVTTETRKRILSNLTGTISEPVLGTPEIASHGLSGALLELPPGELDVLVKLSSLVPDDPSANATTEQLSHSATVHFAVTPRHTLARSS